MFSNVAGRLSLSGGALVPSIDLPLSSARDLGRADVVDLPDAGHVSRAHCRVELVADANASPPARLKVTQLSAANPSFIKRVGAAESSILKQGQEAVLSQGDGVSLFAHLPDLCFTLAILTGPEAEAAVLELTRQQAMQPASTSQAQQQQQQQTAPLPQPTSLTQPGAPGAAAAPPVLLLLVGIPGSGKTSLSRALQQAAVSQGVTWVHVNQDTVSNGKPGTRQQCLTMVRKALHTGHSVVLDRCNVDAEQRSEFLELASVQRPPCSAHAVVLHLPRALCVQRAVARTDHPSAVQGPGAAAVVGRMHGQLAKPGGLPAPSEGLDSIMLCESEADARAALQAWSSYGQPSPLAAAAAPSQPGVDSSAEVAAVGQELGQQQQQQQQQQSLGLAPVQAWLKYRAARGGTLDALWAAPTPAAGGTGGRGASGQPKASGSVPPAKRPAAEAAAAAAAGGAARAALSGLGSAFSGRSPPAATPSCELGGPGGGSSSKKRRDEGAEGTAGRSGGSQPPPPPPSPAPPARNAFAMMMAAAKGGGKAPAGRAAAGGMLAGGMSVPSAAGSGPASTSAASNAAVPPAATGGGNAPATAPYPFHFPPGWSHRLHQLAKKPELPADDEKDVWYDDRVVRLRDKYAKSRHHALVVAREMGLDSLADLRASHLSLLAHMREVAHAWIHLCVQQQGADPSAFRLGFHAKPSMRQLHLHIVSQDFDAPGLKKQHHWNSFNTAAFRPLSAVEAELRQAGQLAINVAATEQLFTAELRCHRCQRRCSKMPELKSHIKVCTAPLPPADV